MADRRATAKDVQPPGVFVSTDLLDPATLVRRLQDDNDHLSRHFVARLRPEALKLLRDRDTSKPIANQLKLVVQHH